MTISIVGTGYVGLVSGTCFAEMGNNVYCIDINKEKINKLNSGVIPIFEPGLEEMVKKNVQKGRLFFTDNFADAVPKSDLCFIAVGTPPGEDGSADISYVLSAAKSIAENLSGYTVVVDKSTVPVGTANLVHNAIKQVLDAKKSCAEFDVVSNPEFLKEGVAIEDFMRPDRVVVGLESERAEKIMKSLYEPFVKNEHPLIIMDTKSAEITKYAANAMLATRISFMNEIASLCEKVGGDVHAVRQGIGSDKRIGMSFLYAGCGYGGSCFPKDVKELISAGKRAGLEMRVAKAVEEVNNAQKHILSQKICAFYKDNLKDKTFALWGLAFKPQTDDMREAPSICVINDLLQKGAKVRAYDPEAFEQAKFYLKDADKSKIEYIDDMKTVLDGADALVILTEWKEFRQPDFDMIKSKLKEAVIFDGRNQFNPKEMSEKGFVYHCIGRNFAK